MKKRRFLVFTPKFSKLLGFEVGRTPCHRIGVFLDGLYPYNR